MNDSTQQLWDEIKDLISGSGPMATHFNECFDAAASEAGYKPSESEREQLLAEIVITRLALVLQNLPGAELEGAPLFIILGKLAGDLHEKEKAEMQRVANVIGNFMGTACDIASLPCTTDE